LPTRKALGTLPRLFFFLCIHLSVE
jgi:hypothetical protein